VLVAVRLHGLGFALAVGLVTPAVNLALTGLPAAARLGPMALEVVVFAAVLAVLVRKAPLFFMAAPVAYAAGKALTILTLWAVPAFNYHRPPVDHWAMSMQNAVPGLLVLIVVDLGLALWSQRRTDWDGE
jgi:hypothetical protein